MRLVGFVLGVSLLVNSVFCAPLSARAKKNKNSNDLEFETKNIQDLAKKELTKLDANKYRLNNFLLKAIKLKHDNPDSKTMDIPSKFAEELEIKNPFNMNIEDLIKMLKTRLDEIDKRQMNIINEFEISKVLNEWEDHANDTTEEQAKVKREFEANKTAHHKQEKFHEPGSKDLEKEVWQKADDLPADAYNPRNFFLMHDLNSDGVWDAEEIDNVLNSEFRDLDEDNPERAAEYRIQIRRTLMNKVDKNKDGVIDYKEHMNYVESTEAANDDGWEPDDDEDEDLEDFGPIPDEKELEEIANKIRSLEKSDPNSELMEQLKDRFEHVKREIELNRSRHL